MARKKTNKRAKKSTLIFIGEGEAEKAFLLHLKSIYSVAGLRVTPRSAGGKGPSNVIGGAIGTLQNSGCDKVAALLDLDLPWPVTMRKQAEKKGIVLIGSNPCLEGLLLDILGEKKPNPCNNESCKSRLHPMLKGKETDKDSYSIFTIEILEEARTRVPELEQLINIISDC